MAECTAAAVTDVLIAFGFPVSTPGEEAGWRSAGVFAADLPLPEPRVGIYCHPEMTPVLTSQLVSAIGSAGYYVERVVELSGEYLVAWTEGDS
jgi:hypothetical protein